MEKGGSRHFLSSRCYFSNFVGQVEKIIDRLLAEEKEKLRECKVLSIFTAPRVPQNIPLLYYLVSVYDARKDTFSIGSRELTFTPNDVALIIGLPNNGDNLVMVQKPYAIRTKATLRKQIAEMDSDGDDTIVLILARCDMVTLHRGASPITVKTAISANSFCPSQKNQQHQDGFVDGNCGNSERDNLVYTQLLWN
ncbi:hypothetical protein KSP40_PGU014592 [Platanthera guangdongensis]|uniref:Uncharacterized protein n=1 Tax=Platanthera guangdongensis TaxID=2320717 RepID=A0ABR2LYU8_9ASPA